MWRMQIEMSCSAIRNRSHAAASTLSSALTPRAVARTCEQGNELMKLTSAQIERTLGQFEARALPNNHPIVPRLTELFGEHTFFLDSNETGGMVSLSR